MDHGIEIYVDGSWIFVPAPDRDHANNLQKHSNEKVPHVCCRRVIRTDEGFIVTVHATE
jgi:hypothetical protein